MYLDMGTSTSSWLDSQDLHPWNWLSPNSSLHRGGTSWTPSSSGLGFCLVCLFCKCCPCSTSYDCICSNAFSCPENTVLLNTSTYCLSVPLCYWSLSLEREEHDIGVSFGAAHCCLLFSMQWPISIHWHLLQKETSLLRLESCINLWA